MKSQVNLKKKNPSPDAKMRWSQQFPMTGSKLIIFKQSKLLYGQRSAKELRSPEEEHFLNRLHRERSLKFIDNKIQKEISYNRLGPGSYSSNSQSPVASISFSSLSRFNSKDMKDKFMIRKEKSPMFEPKTINQRIRFNKNLTNCSFEAKKKEILENAKVKAYAIKVVRKTKNIIYDCKILKRQASLNLKHRKMESMEKKYSNTNMEKAKRTWDLVVCVFGGVRVLQGLYARLREIKANTKIVLTVLYFVSKFIGKIKITLKKFRKNNCRILLYAYLKPLIQEKIREIKKDNISTVFSVINSYSRTAWFWKMHSEFMSRIKRIQRFVRVYSEIKKIRLNLLNRKWQRLESKQNMPGFLKISLFKEYLNLRITKYLLACRSYQVNNILHKDSPNAIHSIGHANKPVLIIYSNPSEFMNFMSRLGKSNFTSKKSREKTLYKDIKNKTQKTKATHRHF